jgi:TatD DNase family protein
MRLVDTHCHLANPRLHDQLDDVLNRARQAGMEWLIAATSDLEDSAASARIAAAHSGVYCTAGIHPHEAKDAPAGWEKTLENLLIGSTGTTSPGNAGGFKGKCLALGEIGLDYHYDFSPRPVQQAVFAAQLELARKLAVPVVIHTREAFEDTLGILDRSGVDLSRVIFHSFTGPPADAGRIIQRGCYVSFSGIVTFKNAQDVRDSALLVPADRLLTETDAPYLSPQAVRSQKTNEPANVRYIVEFLVELRKVPAEELAEQVLANALVAFGLQGRAERL